MLNDQILQFKFIKKRHIKNMEIDPIQQDLNQKMINKNYTHSTNKNEYTVLISYTQDFLNNFKLRVYLKEKYALNQWKNSFTADSIQQITFKTGQQISTKQFVQLLNKALSMKDLSCYVDILSSQDLKNMKARKNQQQNPQNSANEKKQTKSNQRYLILTYMTNQSKFHYPLSLSPIDLNLEPQELKNIYNQLRVQLQAARTSALNDTAKSDNSQASLTINYEKKVKNNLGYSTTKKEEKFKEIDQMKSQNQILKAKLIRLQQQATKKRANIEIQAAIERTKHLKEVLQTQNLQLVDWKNNIQDQQQSLADLKKEMLRLHKKICSLLVTEKQLSAKKKGEQIQKQLNNTKNNLKKNHGEIEKLKKQLQTAKSRIRELELKAKKLNSQKEVIRKGRRGPYSSAGSVRSYGTYSSGARSYGGISNSSKSRSNNSYNSHNKYR